MSRPYSARVQLFRGPLGRSERQRTQGSRDVGTDWDAKVKEIAQEQVPEPVQAAGILQPAGIWGTFGLDQVSGVAAMFKRRKANKDAGGLAKASWKGTKTVLLAVAGDKLYAFAATQKGRKIEDRLGVWNRSDLTVDDAGQALDEGRLRRRVHRRALRARGHDGRERRVQRPVTRRHRGLKLRTSRCDRTGSSRRRSRSPRRESGRSHRVGARPR
jgi:hypothetical protein